MGDREKPRRRSWSRCRRGTAHRRAPAIPPWPRSASSLPGVVHAWPRGALALCNSVTAQASTLHAALAPRPVTVELHWPPATYSSLCGAKRCRRLGFLAGMGIGGIGSWSLGVRVTWVGGCRGPRGNVGRSVGGEVGLLPIFPRCYTIMLLFFLYILDKYTTYIKFCYKNNEYSVEYPWYMLDPPLPLTRSEYLRCLLSLRFNEVSQPSNGIQL